eukprot:TRINITY_DN7363_c0_g1_i1.p1 TRINITY_DN7363_c0_g1~~TRINITY_DN7363_c0_g1_i1.p1  ORF type:complete len:359 (+),score=22.72 TRINITY_DN7363_c0_g1_i1:90-1166(+)
MFLPSRVFLNTLHRSYCSTDHTLPRFGIKISKLHQLKEHSTILKEWNSLKSKYDPMLSQISIGTYNKILNAASKENNGECMRTIVNVMKTKDIKMDVSTYNTLISHHAKNGDPQAVKKIVEEMSKNGIEMDTATYNIILNMYLVMGRDELVRSVLSEMKKKNVQADSYTLSLLVSKLMKMKSSVTAHTIFMELKIMGFEVTDVVSFNSVISMYTRMGKLVDVTEVMKEMQKRNIEPDRVTYNTLIRSCSKTNKVDIALKLYTIMSVSDNPDLRPDVVTINILVQLLFKESLHDLIIHIFEETISRGTKVDTLTCNFVIQSYIAKQHQMGALKVLDFMYKNQIEEDDRTVEIRKLIKKM